MTIKTTKTYFRPIHKGVSLGATDGTQTLWEAKKTFFSGRDKDLINLNLNVPGLPTPSIRVDVYEMQEDSEEDGTFSDICESLGNLDKLCLEQSQIELFCRQHKDKLRSGGYSTFFLFTRGGMPINEDRSNLFVACVSTYDNYEDGRLQVDVRFFQCNTVWEAELARRFVFPTVTTNIS